MDTISCGKVTVTNPGTPRRCTENLAADADTYCHAISIQVLRSNTGDLYVGKSGMNRATKQNVLIVIPPPSFNVLPAFEYTIPLSNNALNAADFYLDADVPGDSGLVTLIVA